jgi:hypothetical protein
VSPIDITSEKAAGQENGQPSLIRTITVAHSPDSDDAFMFYGLATNKVTLKP